jgi:hypothetical protein
MKQSNARKLDLGLLYYTSTFTSYRVHDVYIVPTSYGANDFCCHSSVSVSMYHIVPVSCVVCFVIVCVELSVRV